MNLFIPVTLIIKREIVDYPIHVDKICAYVTRFMNAKLQPLSHKYKNYKSANIVTPWVNTH